MRNVILGGVLLATTAIVTAVPLAAQDRGRGDTFVVTSNQVVDMADARIAQLKADLRLTPDQDKNWGSFQTALHDMAQRRADRMQQMREQRSAAANTAAATPAPNAVTPANDPNARPRDDLRDNRDVRERRADRDRDRDRDADRAPDIVADMRRQADDLTAKADDYRKFADASGPLYTSLDDGQKGRFLAFTQRNMMDDQTQAPPPRRGRDRDRW